MSQVIPSSWTNTELSNIVDFQNGFAFKSQWFVKSGKYQVLKLGNVKVSQLKLESSPAYVSEEIALEYKSYQPQKDDILITMTGTRFKRDYGFVCRVDQKVDALINQRVGRIRNNHDISDSKYLSYFLMSNSFQDEFFEGETGGVSQGNVGSKHILSCNLFLPPLAEQKFIADKLDELLAQVESTKARLDAIPAILKSFRQSVLAAAVSGKLTEEWRGENKTTNVEKSLATILDSRSKLVAKRTKVPELHLESEEYDIHKTWKWVSLDLLASKIVDGVHQKPKYVEKGIPFMSVKDIRNGQISFDHSKYISNETHEEIHPRCNPELGDLLITKSGTIGRTAIVQTSNVFDLFVSVALIKPASNIVNMKFIDIALRQWVNSIDVSSRVVGTAIKNLHLRDMRVLAIPFAPIEEQTEIVRRVEELLAFADKVEFQVNAAQLRVNNLTQSILAKAFRGELTADWRAANPELISGENSASALLERIKASRSLTVKKPKKAKV
jgi:type I restriction enzyme S subunit